MDVTTKHPHWLDRADEWMLMRDSDRGEIAVKKRGETYLRKPPGFGSSQEGRDLYDAYRHRAQFSEAVGPTVQGMVGVIHRTEAQIELPAAMEWVWETATRDGLPLEAFHRRITSEILLTGRYGILADANAAGRSFLAGYTAESLINWSEDRDFYVLDECGLVRDGFVWNQHDAYRVLELIEGRYVQRVYEGDLKIAGEELQPSARGGVGLTEIPFVVVGPIDLTIPPQDPPLIGVARAALAEYQLSADYRWQLFMSGQETLFVINGTKPDMVGAGVVVELQGGSGPAPDAKYVGPAGTGIEAHRVAMADQREKAISMGARLFDMGKKAAESGEALKIRSSAQTATLTSVSMASAQALERSLRYLAILEGFRPEEVTVKPNLDFHGQPMTAQDAEALVRTWQQGAISYQTLYENLQRGEIASAERDFEAELALIDAEEPSPAESGLIIPPREADSGLATSA
jgi:hypothetical protein